MQSGSRSTRKGCVRIRVREFEMWIGKWTWRGKRRAWKRQGSDNFDITNCVAKTRFAPNVSRKLECGLESIGRDLKTWVGNSYGVLKYSPLRFIGAASGCLRRLAQGVPFLMLVAGESLRKGIWVMYLYLGLWEPLSKAAQVKSPFSHRNSGSQRFLSAKLLVLIGCWMLGMDKIWLTSWRTWRHVPFSTQLRRPKYSRQENSN